MPRKKKKVVQEDRSKTDPEIILPGSLPNEKRRKGIARTPVQREEALLTVANLSRRGYSQNEIAQKMGVSQQQVCYDLKIIKKRYASAQEEDFTAYRHEKILQLREIRKEAWEAWERSKQDFTKSVTEEYQSASGIKTKTTEITEGRNPANEYLKTILETLKEENDLMGAYPTKQLDIRHEVINWDAIMGLAANGVPNVVEDALKKKLLEAVGDAQSGDQEKIRMLLNEEGIFEVTGQEQGQEEE